MRAAWVLLLLGAVAFADDLADTRDAVRRAIEEGRFTEAESAADRALARWPGDAVLGIERTKAVRARARRAQRERGYAAAIDLLEPYVNENDLVPAYADACLWGGQEERGVAALRASTADRKVRTWYEFQLLGYLRRYGEIRRRAEQEQDDEWLAWANRGLALHARFDARTARSRWIALGGVLVLLIGAVALFRCAPPAESSAPARASS